MNIDYIQNLSNKLTRRVERLASTAYELYHFSLIQFWKFIQQNTVFVGVISEIKQQENISNVDFKNLVATQQRPNITNEIDYVLYVYKVIDKCVNANNKDIWREFVKKYSLEKELGVVKDTGELERDKFNSVVVNPLYDYLVEQLNEQRVLVSFINRYKQKCEWFNKQQLFKLWNENTQKGEDNLVMHLCEYLHDQGIDFYIEPSSVSGRVDLIFSQKDQIRRVVEAKIFNPEKSKNKSYIISGFNQLYQYTVEYNEPFGFLVIFNTSEKDLKFSLSNKEHFTPFIIHNNKTIFFQTIDIFHEKPPASKRGKLKVIEITENELYNNI